MVGQFLCTFSYILAVSGLFGLVYWRQRSNEGFHVDRYVPYLSAMVIIAAACVFSFGAQKCHTLSPEDAYFDTSWRVYE